MSSGNDKNDDHPFLATIRDTFVPHDQRRMSQGSKDVKPRPRRESDESISSSSAGTATTEMHHDATGVGSHFLEGLTPGQQGRRRSSILEALGGLVGRGSNSQERRPSVGSMGGDRRDGKGMEKSAEKYDMYVRL